MSAIIDNASTIRYQRQSSIAQTKSQSGKRQAQRRGPLLYNFFVEVRPIQFGSDAYYAIEDEILDSNYSENTVNAQIRLGNLTLQRGDWSNTPAVASTGSLTGDSIDISIPGLTASTTTYGRKGDFVQFSGYSKVFQLTADVTATSDSTNATATLPLNGGVPANVTISGTVVFGQNVSFKLQLKDRPEPEFSELDIVNYGSASFEEVL